MEEDIGTFVCPVSTIHNPQPGVKISVGIGRARYIVYLLRAADYKLARFIKNSGQVSH